MLNAGEEVGGLEWGWGEEVGGGGTGGLCMELGILLPRPGGGGGGAQKVSVWS